MYKLTLTEDERKAINFVGNRYPEGDDFYSLLCKTTWSGAEEWNQSGDITFTIAEHIAWEIRELLSGEDSNYGAALFSKAFHIKLRSFCDSIV